jgi:hypothetical protein
VKQSITRSVLCRLGMSSDTAHQRECDAHSPSRRRVSVAELCMLNETVICKIECYAAHTID